MNAPAVVGVDGSVRALAAVDLATREAVRRHAPLRVVHAFIWPYLNVPLGPAPAGPVEGGLCHAARGRWPRRSTVDARSCGVFR